MSTLRDAAPSTAGPLDADPAVARFQQLLRVPTMSRTNPSETDWPVFTRFRELLAELYPLAHAGLELELVAGHSMLFRWRGTTDAAPLVLMAHYDVVAATAEGWRHPPFDAVVEGDGAERVLWARGALDDKAALVAILEAVEAELATGLTPSRDVYLSFGHDEETHGSGAQAAAALLAERGIRPALVLDEGGAIVSGVLPGLARPSAMIGVSEKGITSLALAVQQQGGHASTPPKMTATVRLARAIVRLNARPFPTAINPAIAEMLRIVGAHSSGPLAAVFRRPRLFGPVLRLVFARMSDETNALVRTTTAVTQLSGSMAHNALAERAEAIVNVRVAVGSSIAETVEHVRRAIADPLVQVSVHQSSEPSPVSPMSGPAWQSIVDAVSAIDAEVLSTPYVQTGASDSRWFTGVSDAVYRFTPFEMSAEERATLHAKDERIHVATWLRGIDFYRHLIAGR
ncbi:M20/M25/M40 family metallo-hydrolase [Microterricola pindariensis]|uniref:M20/M25/M40 family metallo-hydrolase n=1 Tax=Microterricola pindariensis TaxID=478010 RepID=UPI0013BE9858|nr:M20/M25/M40 family metallo-hydrolase [Microterricola pindariensis]